MPSNEEIHVGVATLTSKVEASGFEGSGNLKWEVILEVILCHKEKIKEQPKDSHAVRFAEGDMKC